MLNLVTPSDYDALSARVSHFALELAEAISSSGLVGLCPSEGPLVGLYLSREGTVGAHQLR